MQQDLEIVKRLGNLEGSLTSLKEHNQEDHDNFNRQIDCLSKKVINAQLDLRGTVEQLRGSLDTISDLEVGLQALRDEVEAIKRNREVVWTAHDQKCQYCIKRIIDTMRIMMEEHYSQIENLGVIALLKRYWWQFALIAVLLSTVLKIDYTVFSLIVKHLLGGK